LTLLEDRLTWNCRIPSMVFTFIRPFPFGKVVFEKLHSKTYWCPQKS